MSLSLEQPFTFEDVVDVFDVNQLDFLLSNASGAASRPDLVTGGVIAETFFGKVMSDVVQLAHSDERRYYFDFESTADSKVYEIKCFDETSFRRNTRTNELLVFYKRLFQLDAWHDDEKRHWYNGLKPRFVFFSRSGSDALTATYKCEAVIPFCEMIINLTSDRRKKYSLIAHDRQLSYKS